MQDAEFRIQNSEFRMAAEYAASGWLTASSHWRNVECVSSCAFREFFRARRCRRGYP